MSYKYSNILLIVFIEHAIFVTLLIYQNAQNCTLPSVRKVLKYQQLSGDEKAKPNLDAFPAVSFDSRPVYQKPYYYLFLLIITRAEADQRRGVIRETWLNGITMSMSIGYKFVIGTYGLTETTLENLKLENSVYGDILALNYTLTDSYENLSHKVLNAIRWVGQNVNATYIMKADDDVYINLEYFLERLSKEITERKLVIYGYIITGVNPLTDGKWAEKNWIFCPNYFPYPVGIGYIISNGVAKFIMENYKRLKSYKNDDVSIGNWIAPTKVRMQPLDGIEPHFKANACEHWWIMHGFSNEKSIYTYKTWNINHTLCS